MRAPSATCTFPMNQLGIHGNETSPDDYFVRICWFIHLVGNISFCKKSFAKHPALSFVFLPIFRERVFIDRTFIHEIHPPYLTFLELLLEWMNEWMGSIQLQIRFEYFQLQRRLQLIWPTVFFSFPFAWKFSRSKWFLFLNGHDIFFHSKLYFNAFSI